MSAITRFVQRCVSEFPRLILTIFALTGLAAALAASQVRIDSRISGLMTVDDPELERTHWLKETFSNDEVLFVAFELGHPFSAQDLRQLDRISRRIAAAPGVEDVLDLSNIEDVRGDGDSLDGSPLIDFGALREDVTPLRERVRNHRLYRKLLVSDRLDVFGMIILQPPPDPAHPNASKQMVEAVRSVLASEPLTWKVHRVGPPESEALADDLVRRDLATLALPALALSLAVVFLATRSWAAIGLGALLVLWSELILLGWFGLSGTALTMVTALAPVILLAPASIYAIYLMGLLQGIAGAAHPTDELIERFTPSATLSAISTLAGFIALPSINVRGVAELGNALNVGISAAALGSIFLLPVLIDRYSIRMADVRYAWLERMGLFGVTLARRPWTTLAVAAALSAIAIPGLLRIQVDTDPLDYFRSDHEHIRSERFVRENLSGTRVLNVVVETGRTDGALEPAVIGFVDDLVREAERSPVVERAISFLDYIYLMDAALEPEHAPRSVLPSRALLAQYLLLYEIGADPRDLRHFIDSDRANLNVMVRMSTVSSNEILALRDQILKFVASRPDAPKVEVLGHAYLFAKASTGIVSGMARGLALATVLILLVTAIALRSLRLALLSAVPTLAPILVCAGALGWFGVPLSLGTSLVGCLALGLAVDDTAHVISHVDRERGLAHTYAIVGRPLILESLSLSLGFSVLLFSQFQTIAMLGLAISFTLLVALAFDLYVLPSLLTVAGLAPRSARST